MAIWRHRGATMMFSVALTSHDLNQESFRSAGRLRVSHVNERLLTVGRGLRLT